MRRALTAPAVTLLSLTLLALGGCRTSQPAIWQTNFEQRAQSLSTVDDAEVRRAASYEALDAVPQIAGREIVGVSRFREEMVTPRLIQEDSELERYAESIGADLVVLATRPAGKEERTKYIRTTSAVPASGGSEDFTGGPPPARQSDQQAYTAVVDVFDYVVVFYRKQTD